MAARFVDRRDAGRRLARKLIEVLDGPDADPAVVLAVAPGGVPVAVEVAQALHAPMDVLVTRSVTAPGSETPVGAIAGGDPPILDRDLMKALGVGRDQLVAEEQRQRTALRRSERLYREGRPTLSPEGRPVVLVTDGLTGGLVTRAAVRAVAGRGPARLVLAAPVCDLRMAAALRQDVDEIVCLHQTWYLHAAGPWYQDFHEVTDREILRLLARRAALR